LRNKKPALKLKQSLREIFREGRKRGRALFLPYVCVGYPSYKASLETAQAALRAGASALELGMPFSDPIADGPTLQHATHFALNHGTRFADVFRLIRDLRKKAYRQPFLVMTYLNLVEQKGAEMFAKELEQAGGNGAIIPDLPLEEFPRFKKALSKRGLALIPFVAPTSGIDRVRKADAQGAPFLYYVSVTGVTGARKQLPPGLLSVLRELRRKLKTPVVVGFGISNAVQAAQVGRAADGVIIASALIHLISNIPTTRIAPTVERFCRQVVRQLSVGSRQLAAKR
jgi:tryptophan synthase alpha chain